MSPSSSSTSCSSSTRRPLSSDLPRASRTCRDSGYLSDKSHHIQDRVSKTSVKTFALLVLAAGVLAPPAGTAGQTRVFYLKPHDNVIIDGLDLHCVYLVSAPWKGSRDFMLCQRNSDSPRSVYVTIYGDKMEVSRGSGSLKKPEQLLFSHLRDP